MSSRLRNKKDHSGDSESSDDDSSNSSASESSFDGDDLSISDDSIDSSSSSSSSGGGSSSSSNSNSGDSVGTSRAHSVQSSKDEAHEVRRMISKESSDVVMWREIVTGMLIITATIVTVSTYIFLSRQQVESFTSGFQQIARSFGDKVRYDMLSLSEGMESMRDVEMTYASATTAGVTAWPYISLPPIQFERHGEHVHCLSNACPIWTSPIVKSIPLWERYADLLNANQETPVFGNVFEYKESNATKVYGPVPVNDSAAMHAPIHQIYPSPAQFVNQIGGSLVNFDMASEAELNLTLGDVNRPQHLRVSELLNLRLFRDAYPDDFDMIEPLSLLTQPIPRSFSDRTIVSYVHTIIEWEYVFSNFLLESESVYCVVSNSFGQTFTFLVSEDQAIYQGWGDLHEIQYEKHGFPVKLAIVEENGNVTEQPEREDDCTYTLTLYPSSELRASYRNTVPKVYTAVIGSIFFLVAISFFGYDAFVKRRNDKVVQAAARSHAIVSSLFPKNVRDRLMQEEKKKKTDTWRKSNMGLKSYLRDDDGDASEKDELLSKPLADLFPETTILFADIVGFTAWSSVREPSQVFTLLETVYRAFDLIARRRRIFKVETIGDCYVAVAGLPEPRRDHAVAMAKFASDIMRKIHDLTQKMEVTLGPDTGDLTLRIGLHSGPVTAGVLRGERSRFQLFGDTMNTAARMESNGIPNKIQLSQETADLLIAAGKCHWLKPRADKIVAKGKGELNTFWLGVNSCGSSRSSDASGETTSGTGDEDTQAITSEDTSMSPPDKKNKRLSDKTERLIDWNVDVLLRLLQQIVARRNATRNRLTLEDTQEVPKNLGETAFDEVVEIIQLPEFDRRSAGALGVALEVDIPDVVAKQLRMYVSNIARMYNDNPFHNFEHASHVTMSVTKLLSRIVAPTDVLDDYRDRAKKDLVSTLHDHTYGITSDPLTQFACLFSALIHDVDHSGAPNSQLVEEESELAIKYKGKSVAEQNSIDLAWDLLLQPPYDDLRSTISSNDVEFARFRQLVVNSVMATDIMDKELKSLRNDRWDCAFKEDSQSIFENKRDQVNRKATIVIEHLIQASDVSHTMQHWHIYRKWNERFFFECYDAYINKRGKKDPSLDWYEGELGFFDYYIIPLAKKLKECGVFGVSSDEYLQYAQNNRKEWQMRGKEIVQEMIKNMQSKSATKQ